MKKLITVLSVIVFLFSFGSPIALAGTTPPRLEFKRVWFVRQPEGKTIWQSTGLTNRQLQSAIVQETTHTFNSDVTGEDTKFIQVEILLNFNARGAKLLEKITSKNIRKELGIFLDGDLISSPIVNGKISNGQAIIVGNFTKAEAQALVDKIMVK